MCKKELISIIVPVYNVESYLDRCLISITNQSYENLQIILVDDGSTDISGELCEHWKQKDSRVEVIHKKNGGLSSARNEGINHAIGSYVMFIDSDDYIDLETCQKFYECFSRHKADIYVGDYIQHTGIQEKIYIHPNLIKGEVYSNNEFIIKSIQTNSWYAPSCLNMYDKKFLIDNNLYFENGRIHEDVQMQIRLFLKSKEIFYVGFPFYHYVIRPGSIMTSEKNEKKKHDSLLNYSEWRIQINKVENVELKNYLLGFLTKYYLYSARVLNFYGWIDEIITYKEAKKYALNYKERIKVVVYNYFPEIYLKISGTLRN